MKAQGQMSDQKVINSQWARPIKVAVKNAEGDKHF